MIKLIWQNEILQLYLHSSLWVFWPFLFLAILAVTSIMLNNILRPLLVDEPILNNTFWLGNLKDLGLAHGNLHHFSRTLYFSHMWTLLFPIPSAVDSPLARTETRYGRYEYWCVCPFPYLLLSLIFISFSFTFVLSVWINWSVYLVL